MQSRLCFSIAARRSLHAQCPLNIFGRRSLSNYLPRHATSCPQPKADFMLKVDSNYDSESLRTPSRQPVEQKLANLEDFKISRERCLRDRKQVIPARLLARYLDAKHTENAEEINSVVVDAQECRLSPHLMLLCYFMNTPNDTIRRIAITQDQYHQYLQSRGWTHEDVKTWADILSGNDPDEMAHRFCSASSRLPTFVLLEILRKDLLQVDSFEMILTWVRDMINQLPVHNNCYNSMDLSEANQTRNTSQLDEFESTVSLAAASPSFEEENLSLGLSASTQGHYLEMNSFELLIRRLIHQARRIWPPGIVDVSKLISPYMRAILAEKSTAARKLEFYHFEQCCELLNKAMQMFARPAFLEPYKSMVHNWTAQRTLLKLAKQFEPSLTLDQGSYRAIIQVLAALKKSEDESKSATLRTRTWPPWRVHQDGMDAQRPPEDDWSRVVRAIMRLKEAGYGGDWYEESMKVIGGQDYDGTPTIQHRKIIIPRSSKVKAQTDYEMNQDYWVTRIIATRDIQEAWGAFLQFKKRGGIPKKRMYLAMFEKLNYDYVRGGRKSNYKYEAAPGDGKEVLPVPDDNFSEDYKLHHQPPNLELLYDEMLQTGVQPSGKLLMFLLKHARTLDDGFQYLKDSDLSPHLVQYLRSTRGRDFDHEILRELSPALLACFTTFLCRFAPRAFRVPMDNIGMTEREAGASAIHNMKEQWLILENHRSRTYSSGLRQPLHNAIALLNDFQPQYRPAWYPLFKALARDDIVISRELVGQPENQFLAWQVLAAALNDFHRCGLELDPYGFLLICNGFQAYASASYISENSRLVAAKASKIIKVEFQKLSRITNDTKHLMKLLHDIRAVHLHNYVRCLGLVGDLEEIICTLKWMTQHHEELEMNSAQDRNGYKQLRRTLIAVRFFCSGTDSLSTARELIGGVDSWGGWPKDEEVEEYLQWLPKGSKYEIPKRDG